MVWIWFQKDKKTFLSLLGWGQVLRGNADETDAALLCSVDSGGGKGALKERAIEMLRGGCPEFRPSGHIT